MPRQAVTLPLTVTVLYSCTLCAVRDATLAVPARESPAISVVAWYEKTIALVAADHRRGHPHCIARELSDLKVPISGVQWVGGPAIQ